MQPSPLVFDGLRRCLCPGVSRASWFAVTAATISQRTIDRRAHLEYRRSTPRHSQRYRTYVSSAVLSEIDSISSGILNSESPGSDILLTREHHTSESLSPEVKRLLQLRCRKGYMPSDPLVDILKDTSTEDIQRAIIKLRGHDHSAFPDPRDLETERFTNHHKLMAMTKYLIMERNMRESPFVYESLMDAMSHPKGSAQGAYVILRDMHMAGLKFTEAICRSTLRALAVHPHYSLQVHILDVMRENWWALEMLDTQYVVLGLLRDQQYDLAYERFLEMIRIGTQPEIWAYDVMAMTLGTKQHVDEMLGIFELRTQREKHGDSYVNLVYHVLDTCSQASHYEGTKAAWEIGVQGGLFNPSDGILDNVLSTASSHGDPDLTVAAYEMLSSRTRVFVEQYSALIEAFCNAGDLSGALRILSIAEGLHVAPSTIDAMIKILRRYLHNVNDSNAFDQALKAIKVLAADGKPVVNGLRAVIREIARTRGGEHVADLLAHMAAICGEEPDDETLKCMITYTSEKEMRKTFAQQYHTKIAAEAQVPCHPSLYGELIKSCIEIEEYDLAMRFTLEVIRSSGLQRVTHIQWWLPRLLQHAMETGDDRISELHTGITDPKFSTMKSWSMKLWNSLVAKSLGQGVDGADEGDKLPPDEASGNPQIRQNEDQGEAKTPSHPAIT